MTEVLVALVLIAVGALATVTMQQNGTRANQLGYSREAAASLARQLLESANVLNYSDACLDDTGSSYVAPCNGLGLAANPVNAQGVHLGSGGFTRTWRITAIGTGLPDAENRKEIRVLVTWNDRGRTNNLDMASIKRWSIP